MSLKQVNFKEAAEKSVDVIFKGHAFFQLQIVSLFLYN